MCFCCVALYSNMDLKIIVYLNFTSGNDNGVVRRTLLRTDIKICGVNTINVICIYAVFFQLIATPQIVARTRIVVE